MGRLKNERDQLQLSENGFILLDVISDEKLQELKRVYTDLHHERLDIPKDVLYTCLHNDDMEYKKQMQARLSAILIPEIDKLFCNYKTCSFTFQIKGLGENTELFVHQDWSYTNELLGHDSYTFWMPLIDSNEENGTLHMASGSHLRVKGHRGQGIAGPIDNVREYAKKYLKPVRVRAGQILIFNTAILHYSPSNLSAKSRVCVMVNIAHEKSDWFLYYSDSAGVVEEYQVPDNFFLLFEDFKNEIVQRPKIGKLRRKFNYENQILSKERLDFFLLE
jgi:hypothetical protein